MSDDIKQMLIFVGGFILFFAILFATSLQSDSIKHECRLKAIEKGMSASDVQAVCK